MRRRLLLLAALMTPGCGIKRYLPKKAVVRGAALDPFRSPAASGVAYAGPPRADLPVLPLQVFGLFYDLDVVVVSDHPAWDMHEYARVDMPGESLWLAKDSRAGTLVQGIVADVPEIEDYLTEAAVPRLRGPVQVEDRSSGRDVDVRLSYTNMDGDPVDVRVEGRLQKHPPGKRNGSTMGHSAQSAVVALDLQRFGAAKKVSISIGGQERKVVKLLGLQPMRFLLQQAQGGIMVASMVQRVEAGELHVTRPAPGAIDPATGEPGWPTAGEERWTVDRPDGSSMLLTRVDERGGFLRYRFVDGELTAAEAWQDGRDVPVTVIRFAPALPDLRRPFAGTAESRFVIDVNGQEGHATGTLAVQWADDDTVALELRPTDPWWVADRPMDGSLSWQPDGSAVLDMHRVPVED